ncbi:MAG: hypothetical protein IJ272_00595 [Clostridia bacterium]|nr:hypothetical protein [Clostridia bacterium]
MSDDVCVRTGLTAEKVNEVLFKCFYKPEEIQDGKKPDGCVDVKGIVTNFGFHPDRLKEHEQQIIELLSELPETFKEGWSFLNMCYDKNGCQWTGMQKTMEALMALGIAIGKIEYMLPREVWSALPGGVPYIILKD